MANRLLMWSASYCWGATQYMLLLWEGYNVPVISDDNVPAMLFAIWVHYYPATGGFKTNDFDYEIAESTRRATWQRYVAHHHFQNTQSRHQIISEVRILVHIILYVRVYTWSSANENRRVCTRIQQHLPGTASSSTRCCDLTSLLHHAFPWTGSLSPSRPW